MSLMMIVGTQISFGQDFKYEFSLDGVTDPVQAKSKIVTVRKITGAKTAKFNDDTDVFILETHLNMNVNSLKAKFESYELDVQGVIQKTEL